jgi:SAM-dependent methyltransferase
MTDIVKFEVVKKYLKRHSNEVPPEGGIVIDVGGITEYYHLLEPLFYPAQLYISNLDPEHLKGLKGPPLIVVNGLQLPFKNETCDIITSFDVLEHLLQPERFISEASRILRPGGLLILAVANLGDIYSRIAFLFGYTPFQYDPSTCKVGSLARFRITDRGHKSAFTYRAIKELVEYYNFQVIESRGYHYVESFYEKGDLREKGGEMGFERPRRLLGAILPTSLSEGMVLFCKKKIGVSQDYDGDSD